METEFIPLDYDYFDFRGRNYIKVIGRDEKGRRVCVIDTCPVYLWAVLEGGLKEKKIDSLVKEIKQIKLNVKGRNTKVEDVEVHEKKFLGKDVKALKIFATNYKDLHDIADQLNLEGIEKRRGYDLGFVTHYIIERKFKPLHFYKVHGETVRDDEFDGICAPLDVTFSIKLDKFEELKKEDFKPKFLAYDIETDDFKIGEGEIVMISMVSDKFKKVLTWKGELKKNSEMSKHVEFVKNEKELLEKFCEVVSKESPDFLVGYFSDGFDLPYLKSRADKLKVKLALGLDGTVPKFHGGGIPTAKIAGIVHLDLLRFIQTAYSQYMQSETLSLNEVAKEFLGDEKKEFKLKHSSKLDGEDWEKYFEYNLHDSFLTFGLAVKFWPDLSEFTKVMQEPVFDVSRNGMSRNVEDYIIHNLEKFNEIPEKRPMYDEIGKRRRQGKYEGAFVFEPTPDIYEDISIFDFTSSYGSTIVSYNLSRSTLLDRPSKNAYSIEIAGEKVYFSKEPGFFPEMLKDIIVRRKQYKRELKEKPDVIKKARSNAFKLLANASYGYQGFFGARYYCREAAAATAAFAKKTIKEVIEIIDKSGYKTIYSDTDSIAFLMNGKSESEVLKFLGKLNSDLPGIMELELEGFFKRGIWVTKRTGDIGAKKKYALLGTDGKLKIRGFETVRRDWCQLARKVQNKVLDFVLEDGNDKRAFEYVKDTIHKLKKREIEKENLIIRTQLKKSLSEYKAVSPHVIAARKMKSKGMPIGQGDLIEYFVAEPQRGEKKKLVRDRVKLADEKGDYDIDYYLEHQLLPAVENILQVFNVDTKELIEGKKQMSLSDF